jgi:hypothetical protein
MTEGGYHMEWDQIESKWTAMTRRVRGDTLPRTAANDAIGALVSHKTDAQPQSAPEPVFSASVGESDTMPVA